jgi:small-conductance mechanosensitive channel
MTAYTYRWTKAYTQLLICAILSICGVAVSTYHGNIRTGNINDKIISFAGVITFVFFSSTFLHILASSIKTSIAVNRLGAGRAVAIQFILRIIGFISIFLATLELVGISVEKLLVGGAVLGVILGVAAQQALANFFASIVLILSHPFTVGEHVVIKSGALGGEYKGKVIDIGLTHTRIKDSDGVVTFFPNSTLLAGATVRPETVRTSAKDYHA